MGVSDLEGPGVGWSGQPYMARDYILRGIFFCPCFFLSEPARFYFFRFIELASVARVGLRGFLNVPLSFPLFRFLPGPFVSEFFAMRNSLMAGGLFAAGESWREKEGERGLTCSG